MLGCEAEVLPLAIERFCGNSTTLLFENAAPFMVARGILKQMDNTGIGCLGYGAGKQVIKSVGYFSMIQPPVESVLYVGDLDAEGIQLAADVKRLSRHVTILPATSSVSCSDRSWAKMEWSMRCSGLRGLRRWVLPGVRFFCPIAD